MLKQYRQPTLRDKIEAGITNEGLKDKIKEIKKIKKVGSKKKK